MTPTTMPYFWEMFQLMRFHRYQGFHFFSNDNKRFSNSRWQGTPPYNGRVFVTSERMNDRYPRRYSVRYIDGDGHIITVGGFQAFASHYDAHTFAKAFAAETFARVGNESVRLPLETKMV